MKTLTNLALNVMITFGCIVIVMLIVSLIVPLLPYVYIDFGVLKQVNTAIVTAGIFMLLFHLTAYKQGVEHQWGLVKGSFLVAMLITGAGAFIVFRILGTPTSQASQSLAWFLMTAIPAGAGVLCYVTVSTQRKQVGEHVESVYYKLEYAFTVLVGLVGFIVGVSILIYLFDENPTITWEEVVKYVLSDEVAMYLLLCLVVTLLALMKGLMAVIVQAVSAIGFALFSIAILLLILVQVIGVAPNDVNFWILTAIASMSSGMSSIFILELLYVFAHEAGH